MGFAIVCAETVNGHLIWKKEPVPTKTTALEGDALGKEGAFGCTTQEYVLPTPVGRCLGGTGKQVEGGWE